MSATGDLFITQTMTVTSNEVMNVTSEATTWFWENSAAKFLYAVPSIILLILGTIGNTLSFIVFNGQNMRHSVTSVYFRILAVTDTLVLFSGGIVFFILGAFDLDIRLLSRGSCKFWTPLLLSVCYQSCWVLVFIAVDRFIGVWRPHKYRKFCSQKTAIINCIALFLVVTLTIFVYWAVIMELSEDGTTCGVAENHLWFFLNVFNWINLILLNLIPSIALVSLNICIIYKISQAAIQRQTTMSAHSGGGKKISNEARQSNNATYILLSISLVYILCTIPTSTTFLVVPAFGTSPHGVAQATLYQRSCETLYLTNHALNFILYCVHGSGFRKELKKLFKSRQSLKKSNSVGTNSTAMSVIRPEKYTRHENV